MSDHEMQVGGTKGRQPDRSSSRELLEGILEALVALVDKPGNGADVLDGASLLVKALCTSANVDGATPELDIISMFLDVCTAVVGVSEASVRKAVQSAMADLCGFCGASKVIDQFLNLSATVGLSLKGAEMILISLSETLRCAAKQGSAKDLKSSQRGSRILDVSRELVGTWPKDRSVAQYTLQLLEQLIRTRVGSNRADIDVAYF